MQIKMQLERCTAIRLQKSAFLMNYFYGEEYFKFDKYKYGPFSHSLDMVAKGIGEFQQYYKLKDTKKTYEMAYQVLCSEKVDSELAKLKDAISLATQYVNKIEKSEDLEGISTVLYLVQLGKNNNTTRDDIQEKFRTWSEDKAKRFSEEDIDYYLGYLQKTGLIEKNMVSNYEAIDWKAWH